MNLVWQAEDVLRAVRGQSLHAQDWSAHGVSIDSRSLQKDDVFVAIKGPSLDGHDFVHAAFEAGASAAIVEKQPPQAPSDARLIHVEDSFTALQDLGRVGRARANASILAVTGSVGKTSSKEMLRLMLGEVKDTYANEGSLNNHWGVPLSLARLPQDACYGVFEIGMNHAGELGPLSREVRPHIAFITNVEAVHLEFFASTEAIATAKAEIFLGMDPAGIAVLNRDNPHFAHLLAAARTQGLKKVLSFGRDPKSDARLLSIEADTEGSSVRAVVLDEEISFRIGAPGAHLALNALGALLSCAAASEDPALCAQALVSYRPPSGRGVRETISSEEKTFTLLDESFNASPTATRAAIAVLSQMPTSSSSRRIAVLGDMRELGETSAALHMSLAETLIENKISVVHSCGEMMARLHAALPETLRGYHEMNSKALAPLVAQDVRDGDVVMIKGSKSMKMLYVVEALRALGSSPNSCKRAG